jgi:hypothetical protein
MLYKEGLIFIISIFALFEVIRWYSSKNPKSFKQSIFNILAPSLLVYAVTLLADKLFFNGGM